MRIITRDDITHTTHASALKDQEGMFYSVGVAWGCFVTQRGREFPIPVSVVVAEETLLDECLEIMNHQLSHVCTVLTKTETPVVRNRLSGFRPGRLVATPGAHAALQRNDQSPFYYLLRHLNCDWGIMPEEDKQTNNDALQNGARLMSYYLMPDGTRLWIITEAADENGNRSVTTLLLPDEY